MMKGKIVWRLLVPLLVLLTNAAHAELPAKKERILLILDASASMQQQWQDTVNRYQAASAFILQLIDSVYARNHEVEFALRVYGHQYPSGQNNCYDTKLEVMYSMDNYTQMELRLASLHAIGITPVSFAINEALDYDMTDGDRYNYHLVIITDGGESCGGNLCAISKKITDKQLPNPCIISLVSDAVLREQYSCLGNYKATAKRPDITDAIHELLTGCCIVPNLIKKKISFNETPSIAKPKQGISAPKPVTKDSVVTVPPKVNKETVELTDSGFGLLKVADVSTIKKIRLFYKQGTGYMPLTKMDISQLFAGQQIRMKTGDYKIVYLVQTNPPFTTENSKTFKIVNNMITEIELK